MIRRSSINGIVCIVIPFVDDGKTIFVADFGEDRRIAEVEARGLKIYFIHRILPAPIAREDQLLTIGRPIRIEVITEISRESQHTTAIAIHQVDLGISIAVAYKRDPFAVRGNCGLDIEPAAVRQTHLRPAIDAH